MAKPKPKGWNAMSKAKQDAWKKANFNKSVKVTEAQLDKLRKEGTPTKAIAKYKNDPAMREALNRFYGKKKVDGIAGTGSTTGGDKSKLPPGKGPGYTRTKGPGPNYIGAGNVANYKTVKIPGSGMRAIGAVGKTGTMTRSMDQQRRAEQKAKSDTALIVGGIIPGIGVAGKVAPKVITGASKVMPKVVARGTAVANKVKSMTAKKVTTQAAPKVVATTKKTTTMKTVTNPKVTTAVKKNAATKATKATATKAPAKTTAKKTTTPKKGSQ
jgi:hypothetical protein